MGFFANRDDARSAFSTRLGRGLARERLQILEADSAASAPVPKAESDAVLKDIVVDGTIGTAVASPAPDAGNKEGKEGWLSALVRDAIASGQIVPVVDARTEEETAIAREIIQASVGDDKDISMA